jgi:hypothetical protein
MLGRILKPRNICRTSYRNLITIVPYITPKVTQKFYFIVSTVRSERVLHFHPR